MGNILISITFFISLNSMAMIKALNTAATGMAAQEANLNAISNNIANVNTVGFKKGRVEFEDLLYQTVQDPGGRSSANTKYNVGIQIGTGSKVSAIRKEFIQGSPQLTKNPFDLMIRGDGFLGIILGSGEVRYTRDGSFNVDNTGTLVNSSGNKVFPGFTFPPNTKTVNISEDGKVDVYINGQVEPNTIGNIPVFTFVNPVGLRSTGKNLYQVSDSSGSPLQHVPGVDNAGFLQQGALESSNVSIMNEMTSMIKAQRAFEMNSKVMGVADQMLQTINNIR